MGYDNEIILAFLEEVSEYIPQLKDHLKTLAANPKSRDALEECYRLSHSIKGSASMLEMEDLRKEGLSIEQALLPYYEKRDKPSPVVLQGVAQHVSNIEDLLARQRRELEGEPEPEPALEPFDDQPTTPPVYNPPWQIQPAQYPPQSAGPEETLDDLIRELGTGELEAKATTGQKPDSDFDLFGTGFIGVSAGGNGGPVAPAPSAGQEQWKDNSLYDLFFSDTELEQAFPSDPIQPQLNKKPAPMPYPFPPFEGEGKQPGFPGADSKAESEPLFDLGDFQPFHLPPSPNAPHQLDQSRPAWISPNQGKFSIEPFRESIFFGNEKEPYKPEPLADEITGLEDILSTQAVDEHVSRLQDEILPHIPDNLPEFEAVPMPSRIVMTDAELLASLGSDLPRRDEVLGLNLDAPPAPTGFEFEHEKLHDFADAADLLTGLEPENGPTAGDTRPVTQPQPETEEWAATSPVQFEAAAQLEQSLSKPAKTGMTAEEEAAIERAIAAMSQGETEPDLSEFGELSEEEMAALAAMGEGESDLNDFGFDPGPLFLAEAQGDLDKLVELVGQYGPNCVEDGTVTQLQKTAATMRKAAEMMDLPLISRQLRVIEDLGGMLETADLKPEPHIGEMLKSSLDDLLFLLAPYREAAQAVLAPPVEQGVELEAAEAAEVAETVEETTFFGQEPVTASQTAVAAPPAGVVVDAELAEVFASEAEEHIQSLDKNLADLERHPENRELVREIRRTAHTLKGSAAMVGFNIISQTAHLMEDLLDRLYDGSVEVNEEVVNLLFATFNAIDSMVRGVSRGKPENPHLLHELRPHYNELLETGEEETTAGGAIIFEPKPATPLPAPEPVAAPVTRHVLSEEEVAALEAAQARQAVIEQAETPGQLTAPLEVELGVRVPIKRLDEMINQVGEMVINRTVLEQRSEVFNRAVEEFILSLKRLQRVTHDLETRYEVELLKTSATAPAASGAKANVEVYGYKPSGNGNGNGGNSYEGEFDTLEMDRYTEFHQLSREMSETVADLAAIQKDLDTLRDEMENVTVQQGRITDDLQDRIMKVRLVPLSNLTPRLYRTLRTVAASEGKDIQFEVSGDTTQVDKTIFEEIGDPLVHLIRNAVDHGIELPEVRETLGKPRQGTITFAARSEGTQVIIEVKDDGTGIDTQMLLQKGIEKGMVAPDAHLSVEEIYNLMFMPGFSTSVTISEISGRGVGLDVVQANIANLKGVIEVTSELGKGTTFTIRLPSTLAITRAILVRSQGFTYAIPLGVIERTTRLDAGRVKYFDGRPYFRLEEETQNLPLIDLRDLLRLPPHLQRRDDDEQEYLRGERPVLFLSGADRCALQADTLVGQQEIVIKNLGTHLKAMPGLLGSTILGNGEVILILNVHELLMMAGARHSTYSSGYIASSGSRGRAETRGTAGRAFTTGNLGKASDNNVEVFRQRRAPLIQVVDDSLSVRKVLSSMLEKAGFRVRTSKDGQEALETIEQQSLPDLIIMDIEMPRMDGYELTGLLKSSSMYNAVPIVMLTSRAGLKHRQKAEEVGADGFLVKPYKEEELLHIVSTLLLRASQPGVAV